MQSLDDDERKLVLGEVLADELKAIHEYVKDIPDIKRDVAVLKADVNALKADVQELKFDMKAARAVIKDHSRQLNTLIAS